MFVDYYALLEIAETATQAEIKSAFKKQALKWHPDRNLGKNTTIRMQEINEAYLILKDEEARNHYNIEYQGFKQFQRKKETNYHENHKRQYEDNDTQKKKEQQNNKSSKEENEFKSSDYTIKDEILKNWMSNAKQQAINLAKQSLSDLVGMAKVGTKEALISMGGYFVLYVLISIVLGILFYFFKYIRG